MAEDAILAPLAAKQAIRECLYRYCRAMDRKDRELGRALWHPDGTADYGPMFRGTGAGFVEWVTDIHETMIATSHQLANILIETDGLVATSESSVTAALRREVDGQPTDEIVRGRYYDRWSYRDGRWAIDHRKAR